LPDIERNVFDDFGFQLKTRHKYVQLLEKKAKRISGYWSESSGSTFKRKEINE
jgi:hypothetical protein